MKKAIRIFCAALLSAAFVLPIAGCKGEKTVETSNTEKEFRAYFDDPASMPFGFVYDGVRYDGLGRLEDKGGRETRGERRTDVERVFLTPDKKVEVKVCAALYPDYDAYEWTLYFSNVADSDSAVLEQIDAADVTFDGESPALKGNYGDHGKQYLPYEFDLTEDGVEFVSASGRPTHEYFCYFDIETSLGGAMASVGWPGTWQASFNYENGKTRYKAGGTVGFEAYLKSGETVRSPLMSFVRYYERDEDLAANRWRRWYLDCNMPKQTKDSDSVVQPCVNTWLAYDTGRPNSDGSISETYETWKPTVDKLIRENIRIDNKWFDAGWYVESDGSSISTEWTHTGTWELDKTKWPDDTLKECNDYIRENLGAGNFMWFEPERIAVSQVNGLKNYGYNLDWLLPSGNPGSWLTDYSDPACVDWTFKRITSVMKHCGVDFYREDFNADPFAAWQHGDFVRGKNRRGITENLYVQGHLSLWDRILEWCAQNGKRTYIDSCASGGGRNDLESLRRAVPFLRSDSDRTSISLRLSMTTSVVKWFPFTGAWGNENAGQLDAPTHVDLYESRGSYLPAYNLMFEWSNPAVPYDVIRQSISEWERVSEYFYDDYYVLTPWKSQTEKDGWTAFMYFDAAENGGVVQVFRQEESQEGEQTIALKGLRPDKRYRLTDADGINGASVVTGRELLDGYDFYLAAPRSAAVIFIEEVV